MEYPGNYLRAERLRQNLSLVDVAKSTRIHKDILYAIEEGRDDQLPPPFYLKAFLTTYAKYLGLDPKDLIPQSQENLNTPLNTLSPKEPKWVIRSPRKIGIQRKLLSPILAISLFFFFIIVTYFFSGISVEQVFQGLAERPSVTPQISSIPASRSPIHAKSGSYFSIENAPSQPFEIIEAAIGKEIEKEGGFLRLTEACTRFLCNNQKVFFLTRTKGKSGGKLTHVWSWKGREFYRIEIDINPPTRTVYSYFTLRPNHIGDWTVEVRDGENVLKKLTFEATSPDTYS